MLKHYFCAMTSETLKLLNLSPIPEISEMELSTVLEQLSSLSDMNGEVTDRNVEDILREAEELIDSSISVKADSLDSKSSSLLCIENGDNSVKETISNNNNVSKVKETNSDDLSVNKIFSSSQHNDVQKYNKSESLKSTRNEMNVSESELSTSSASFRTPRSLTNHIQSTLDSLRECSMKIENQIKLSPQRCIESSESSEKIQEEQIEDLERYSLRKAIPKDNKLCFGEQSDRCISDNSSSDFPISNQIANKVEIEKNSHNKNIQKAVRQLNFDESIKTVNCFERLYRGYSLRTDPEKRRQKQTEKIMNQKKFGYMKSVKTNHPYKSEIFSINKKPKTGTAISKSKIKKQHSNKSYETKSSGQKERTKIELNDLTEEDISFEKCLELLNEETESTATDGSSNCMLITEKLMKQYNESIKALQKEISDLRSNLKRSKSDDCPPNWDSSLQQKFWSQENIIEALREENMKLFKEISEIKGQLQLSAAPASRGISEDNVREVETKELLETDGKIIRPRLITASSAEDNGIFKLQEQFLLLKQKYDDKIGKLEVENLKLRGNLVDNVAFEEAAGGKFLCKDDKKENWDVGIQTEFTSNRAEQRRDQISNDVFVEEVPFVGNSTSSFQQAPTLYREQVGACNTKNSSSQTDSERLSVSVQCQSELDLKDIVADPFLDEKGVQLLKESQKSENKENLIRDTKKLAKAKLGINPSGQALNPWRQRKVTEHENQLMVSLRALHSEVTIKDRENKKMKNELEILRGQLKRLTGAVTKHKPDVSKKHCHTGSQTIGFGPKVQEQYDPTMFQVSKELEDENVELKSKIIDLEKIIIQLKDKRIHDLQILQKLHEEEIDKLASRLSTQTALTNHLHSLLVRR